MKLQTNHPELYNDLCESIRAFLPREQIELADKGDLTVNARTEGAAVTAAAEYNVRDVFIAAEAEIIFQDNSPVTKKRILKRAMKLSVYRLLCKMLQKELPWGSLTGIRPTKLVYDNNLTFDELEKVFGVSKSKTDLLKSIIMQQKDYISPPEKSIDIYIGIPFCRTRCVYCSFATHDAVKGKLIAPYMEALFKEIEAAASFLKRAHIIPRCLYIGGGTPTALNEQYLKLLLEACACFSPELEYTVEAGRPDTLNSEKLSIIKQAGANRISINPQSMHPQTLELIGRQHSPDDIIRCYQDSAKLGFDSVNMDLIAGLPGENEEMFKISLQKLTELRPDNITVHTLSLKKGSTISEYPERYPMPSEAEVGRMVEYAAEKLKENVYYPYYLYRQKYQAGNLENVGYCRQGRQCVYNIDIMEETASIIALGAGAVSKRVYRHQNRIERCGNSKSIYDYIDRIDQMIAKKLALFEDFV